MKMQGLPYLFPAALYILADASVPVEQIPQPVPLCLDLGLQCKAGDLLAAVAASIIQTKGPEQGHVYDTPSAALLTNSTAYALVGGMHANFGCTANVPTWH
jgi:hypothetical protein